MRGDKSTLYTSETGVYLEVEELETGFCYHIRNLTRDKWNKSLFKEMLAVLFNIRKLLLEEGEESILASSTDEPTIKLLCKLGFSIIKEVDGVVVLSCPTGEV